MFANVKFLFIFEVLFKVRLQICKDDIDLDLQTLVKLVKKSTELFEKFILTNCFLKN